MSSFFMPKPIWFWYNFYGLMPKTIAIWHQTNSSLHCLFPKIVSDRSDGVIDFHVSALKPKAQLAIHQKREQRPFSFVSRPWERFSGLDCIHNGLADALFTFSSQQPMKWSVAWLRNQKKIIEWGPAFLLPEIHRLLFNSCLISYLLNIVCS